MTRVSRRAVLAALLAGGALPARAEGPSLRDAARTAGLLFGSSSEIDLTAAPDYAALLTRQCDLFAPNLNWKLLAPTAVDTLAWVDPGIQVATASGLRLTGYHLLWHGGTPQWFEPLGTAAAERALREHIDALGGRLGADSFAWNPVNEALAPAQGRPDGLRRTVYLEKFGPAQFDLAFAMARDAAPGVLRVYNDYDLELATPEHAARRAALLRLLDELLRRAVPVQAVGLQCHLRSSNFAAFDPVLFRGFLRELAARGLPILITELDVLDLSPAEVATRDLEIAAMYRRFLDAALDETAVISLATWGLSDRYTWLVPATSPRFRRSDGAPGRPLPFDRELRPKPAVAALLETLAAAPQRPAFRPA